MQRIVIHARKVREGDPQDLPGVPETYDHVAWIEGDTMSGYEKNTGESDAEAIGSLLIELMYKLDPPFIIDGMVLEDIEGPFDADKTGF